MLRQYNLLDTLPEQALDDLTALAAHICEAPISLISLIDEKRQWFKSRVGLSASETPREISFCGHVILQSELFIVADAARDERFADNPLVTGDPNIRFYAGAPLLNPQGHALGTLCIIDRVPRELNASQQQALRILSRQVMAQLELRRQTRELSASEARLRTVTDTTQVGLVIVNAEHRYRYANPAYANILRLPAHELVGQRVADVLPSVYPTQIRPRLERAFRGERVNYELILPPPTPDQEARQYAVTYEPAAEGAEPLVVVVIVDITQRKQTEEGLRDSERNLTEAQRIAHVGSWSWDLTGPIQWTDELYRIYGVSPVTFTPTVESFFNLVYPEDRPAMREWMRACGAGECPPILEFRAVRPDGTVRFISGQGELLRDAEGRPLRMAGTAQDITERRRTEEALRASHDRLKKVLEIETVGVMFWDLTSGCMTDANDTFLNLTGYSRSDVESRSLTWQKLTPPEYMEVSLAEIQKFEATGRVGPYEKEYLRKDGTRQWFVFAGSSLGHNTCVEFCVDISERKRAETTLRESEARMRLSAEAANVGLWDWDLRTNQVYYSAEWKSQIGYKDDEISNDFTEWQSRVHPDDIELTLQKVRAFIANPQGRHAAEFRFRHKDGSYRWIDTHADVLRDAADKPARMLGCHIDITERKRAEAALRGSEQRLRSILDTMFVFVGLMNLDGVILEVNRNPLEVAGLKREDVLGRTVAETYWYAYSPALQARVRQALARAADGEVIREDYVIRVAEGRLITIDMTLAPLRDASGRITQIVGSAMDITERKQAEERVDHLNRVYSVLSEINQTIVREKYAQAMLAAACRIAVEKGGFSMAWIGLCSSAGGPLELVAQAGATPDTLAVLKRIFSDPQLGCAFTRRAVETGRHAVCNDIARDPLAAAWRAAALERDYRAMVALPVTVAGQPAGTFNLYSSQVEFFDEKELCLLDEGARQNSSFRQRAPGSHSGRHVR